MSSVSAFHSGLIPRSSARPGDDPIFALNARAKERAQRGEDVLNATLGALYEDDGQLAILPSLFEALRQVPDRQIADYAPIAGSPAFLAAVIRDLFGEGELAGRAVAAATPGGTGALFMALQNFLEPKQRLLTGSYYWGPYGTLADHTDRGLETFPLFDSAGRFDVGGLEAALARQLAAQGRALIFINTPCNNPTGYALDEAEWQALCETLIAANQRGPVTLLIDHAYAAFAAATTADWRPFVARLSEHLTVLIAWTASKAFTLYGGRVGALVALSADPAERTRLKNAFGYSCRGTWSNCNHLGQAAVARVLTEPALAARAKAERSRLTGLLESRVAAFNAHARRAGLSYPRYEGGFFVSVFAKDGAAAVERAIQKGVFLVPLQGAVRVALCATPAASVPRLVETLAQAL